MKTSHFAEAVEQGERDEKKREPARIKCPVFYR